MPIRTVDWAAAAVAKTAKVPASAKAGPIFRIDADFNIGAPLERDRFEDLQFEHQGMCQLRNLALRHPELPHRARH
jgi:hypothetical protein